MRPLFALITAFVLVLFAASCGDGKSSSGTSKTSSSSPEESGDSTPPPVDAEPEEPEEPEDDGPSGSSRPRRGGGSSSGASVEERPGPEDAAADAVGRIVGVALFEGTPPERVPNPAPTTTAGCKHHHTSAPLMETIIVNEGKVENVLVYIKKGLEDWTPSAVSEEPVVLNQLGCIYAPHVVAVRTQQKLHVRNSDPTAHNVHFYPKKNSISGANQTQAAGAADYEYEFEREEIPIKIGCDIHPWMRSYLCVVEHPFFMVTGADGTFSLEGLPPGDYSLVAWHEKLKKRTANFTLAPGGEVEIEFTFSE